MTPAAEPAAGARRSPDAGREPTQSMLRDAPVIPGYELLDVLGRGGMGIVYLAEQMSPRRIVALKTIIAGPLASPALSARFRREVEAVGRVPHPHIVTLFEIGEHQGHPFFTMEYLGGGTLADRIQERRFTGDEAAAILIKLARAVHSAHQFGFVHRDLKPSNILFTAEGTPKIADFGLVKWLTEAQEEAATRSGEIMGTLSYMSPEQASGNSSRVDAASDVYSLGVILYEMLTGRCPFVGDNLITQILTSEVPSPAWLCPGISRNLERICLRALRKDPRDRYQTAEQFARDLERYLNREPIDKPSVWYRVKTGFRRQWKLHRGRMLTIAAAVCLIAVTAAWGVTGYLYRWEHVRYYNDFTLHWLQVLGQGAVPAEDVASRFQTYEVVSRGRLGPPVRVTVVGPDGLPSSLNRVEPFLFDIRDGLPTQSKEVSYLIEYDETGLLVKQTALDFEGAVIWQFLADYAEEHPAGKSIVTARYLDAEGNDIDTPTGSGKIRMTLDSDGWIERVDFLTGKGTPAACTHGYFGFRYEYDDQHHIVRQVFIDADGNPMLSRDGVAGVDMAYDSRGRLVRSTYFATDGKPAATDYGQASLQIAYDEFGNMIEMSAQDGNGLPAPLGGRGSNSSLVRETYGYEKGLWLAYSLYTDADEIATETTFEYGIEGDRIRRSTRNYVAPGIVITEEDSMLDRNYLEVEECAWTGGRQFDASPECTVYERDEFGRVISETHYAGDRAASEEPPAPTKIVENHYRFGRLAAYITREWSDAQLSGPDVVLTELEYDDLGRLAIARSYHGETSDPESLFKLKEHEYDRVSGRMVQEKFYADEARAEPYFDPDEEWSVITYEYTPFGRLARKIYTGFPDELNYSRMVRVYDSLESMTSESYWRDAADDSKSEPARCRDGWSRREITYDRFGYYARDQYFGYSPESSYHEYRVDFRHDLLQQIHTAWDENGLPARFEGGHHRWVATDRPDRTTRQAVSSDYPDAIPFDTLVKLYDEHERVIESNWLDADGNPVRNEDGYQGQKSEYWPDGTLRRRERWGLDVESVGYPVLITLFDEQERIIEERAEDGFGNLVVPPGSNSIDEYLYDGDLLVEGHAIGFDQSIYGVYRKNVRYDESERMISLECLDEAGHCIPCRLTLFGRASRTYDDENHLVRQVNTVLADRIGADRWIIVQNDAGQVLSEEFEDAEGNPITSRFGFARATVDYTTTPPTARLVDVDGQPVVCEVQIEFLFAGEAGEQAGLRVGDIVLSFAGVPITSRQILKAVQDSLADTDEEIPVVVRRGDEEVPLRVPPGLLGVYWWERPVAATP